MSYASIKNTKKELFAQKWFETGNKSEAYRYSHPTANEWKDATVHNKASALSKDDEVLARLEELKELAVKRHDITIDSLIDELEQARCTAMTCETPQTSAAVTATMSKAKLLGLDKQIIDHTSSDGSMSPKDLEISDEQFARVLNQLRDEY